MMLKYHRFLLSIPFSPQISTYSYLIFTTLTDMTSIKFHSSFIGMLLVLCVLLDLPWTVYRSSVIRRSGCFRQRNLQFNLMKFHDIEDRYKYFYSLLHPTFLYFICVTFLFKFHSKLIANYSPFLPYKIHYHLLSFIISSYRLKTLLV